MKHKGDDCYSITRTELLAALGVDGAYLWTSKFGPHMYDREHRELHPRTDTVSRLIADGVLAESGHANKTQRECGMNTFKLFSEVE